MQNRNRFQEGRGPLVWQQRLVGPGSRGRYPEKATSAVIRSHERFHRLADQRKPSELFSCRNSINAYSGRVAKGPCLRQRLFKLGNQLLLVLNRRLVAALRRVDRQRLLQVLEHTDIV